MNSIYYLWITSTIAHAICCISATYYCCSRWSSKNNELNYTRCVLLVALASFVSNILSLTTSIIGYSVSPSDLAVVAFGSASYATVTEPHKCCCKELDSTETLTLPLFQWGNAKPLLGFSAFTSAAAGCFNTVLSCIACNTESGQFMLYRNHILYSLIENRGQSEDHRRQLALSAMNSHRQPALSAMNSHRQPALSAMNSHVALEFVQFNSEQQPGAISIAEHSYVPAVCEQIESEGRQSTGVLVKVTCAGSPGIEVEERAESGLIISKIVQVLALHSEKLLCRNTRNRGLVNFLPLILGCAMFMSFVSGFLPFRMVLLKNGTS